jgi:hypothetical protein
LSTACAKIDTRRAELHTAPAAKPSALPYSIPVARQAPDTPADKVRLFRLLFRGRTDVFPIRFVSKKTGNPGYAPACSNKWEPGLCHLKSGGKCSDCPNQSFVPVEDRVVIDHLRGRHVIGCYPMLEDETTWFLAVDFDKTSWKEDVASFAETSHLHGTPAAIERSRSGNGAHAWFFFTSPYPRTRIDPALATKIAQEAIRTDQVVGVRFSELTDDHEDSTPWTTPSSKRDSAAPISGPLPSAVTAVLSQRLRRVGVYPDQRSASRCIRAADPISAEWVPVPRRREIRGQLRSRHSARSRRVHGELAGPMGARCGQRSGHGSRLED